MFTRNLTVVATLLVVFALAPSAQALDIDINDALVPDELGVGDTFQLAWVASESVTQGANIPFVLNSNSETDINVYNSWVQQFADNAATGSIVTGKGLTWKIIGSTQNVNAKDNAVLGASTPLYNVLGGKIATGYGDLWDGSILIPMNTTQAGTINEQEVTTGTQTNGDKTGNPLGNNPSRGHGGASDGDWIYKMDNADENSKVYAMSEETLTVIVPEPATMSLLVLGGLGVLARRRRRRA